MTHKRKGKGRIKRTPETSYYQARQEAQQAQTIPNDKMQNKASTEKNCNNFYIPRKGTWHQIRGITDSY